MAKKTKAQTTFEKLQKLVKRINTNLKLTGDNKVSVSDDEGEDRTTQEIMNDILAAVSETPPRIWTAQELTFFKARKVKFGTSKKTKAGKASAQCTPKSLKKTTAKPKAKKSVIEEEDTEEDTPAPRKPRKIVEEEKMTDPLDGKKFRKKFGTFTFTGVMAIPKRHAKRVKKEKIPVKKTPIKEQAEAPAKKKVAKKKKATVPTAKKKTSTKKK